jgi:hypothetical protein
MKLKEYKAEKEEWTRRDGEIKEDKKKKKVWEEIIAYLPLTLLAPLFRRSVVILRYSVLKDSQQFESL